jgi:hypothetical protein
MLKSLILSLHEKDPGVARKVVHYHKNIQFRTDRPHPSRTNYVHMKKFSWVSRHHLIDRWMRNSNHLPMATRVTNKVFLKDELGQSSDNSK